MSERKPKPERFTGAVITVTTPDGHEMTQTMTLTEVLNEVRDALNAKLNENPANGLWTSLRVNGIWEEVQ